MRIKITEEEYYTLKKALQYIVDNTNGIDDGGFLRKCFFLQCKIEKAKNYSDSSKQRARGIVQRKQNNAIET